MNKQELIARIEELRENMANFELDESDYEEQFRELLDECYEGLFGIPPSRIMEKCDPIMYACELSNYVDSLDKEQDAGYSSMVEELEELENQLEDLDSELTIRF